MQDQSREKWIYAAGLAATIAHVGYAVAQGPQPIGERPLASPAVWAANYLGFWALIWLLATLACTPARLWLGATWPSRWRRTLGLTAAGLAVVHVATWQIGEHGLNLPAGLGKIAETPWLMLGSLALLTLLVLAATSPAAAVKRLGAARWKKLHRLVYVGALLVIGHYAARATADPQHWIGFGLVLALLLGARRGRPADR
ncbi:MAG: ferric reductase-like transmembrane domain-containing protein [Deltaproteobacteria bacterium]|nr:ferric reductase-like transmembrane domain-containing protein [Deltaproteobacteria bacterium]